MVLGQSWHWKGAAERNSWKKQAAGRGSREREANQEIEQLENHKATDIR